MSILWYRAASSELQRFSTQHLLEGAVCLTLCFACIITFNLHVKIIESTVKESSCNVRVQGSIPGSGRSPEEGNDNSLQCSWLENSMDRGAWWATVYGVAKSQTRLSRQNFFQALFTHPSKIGNWRSERLVICLSSHSRQGVRCEVYHLSRNFVELCST